MFGLINVAIQGFVEDTYGRPIWEQIARAADVDFIDFEAMLSYEDALTEAVLDNACTILRKEKSTILEDLGTFLVTNPKMERVRRLLRFGGREFEEFLMSLDELTGRVGLAIPDLEMPQIDIMKHRNGQYKIRINCDYSGYGAVLVGILQAVADDYGALVLSELRIDPCEAGFLEQIDLELLETSFSEDRGLDLAAGLTA
ncbi:MAG: heme NO-binding domain-containing protein [Litoreibacter sp.]|nr:heme NO-binding domain-containing protein [Litoreibacter sp.]MCY4336725.1 heme NO-binding domain-containing protein [Litoreibacter sp.]